MLYAKLHQPTTSHNYFKLLIAVLFLCTLLSSCNKYQYGTISSSLPNNNQHEYIDENDLYKISYSFSGEHCPLKIMIQNKHNLPMYVDWQRSFVIIDSVPMPLKEKNSPGTHVVYDFDEDCEEPPVYNTNPERPDFIPSGTRIKYTPFNMSSKWIHQLDTETPERKKLATDYGESTANYYYYTQENSPLYFKSYIRIAYDEAFVHPINKEAYFWIDKLMYSYTDPNEVKGMQQNWFYDTEITEFGQLTMGCATISLAAAILIVSLAIEDEETTDDF